MSELSIEYRSIDALIPYARNSRTHSDSQVAQIAGSIKEFGFTNPILIDEDGGIIAGHGRVLGARKLELSEVPTITLIGLTDAQKRAYVIADNKLALNAGWDQEMLRLELADLDDLGFDMDLVGFEEDELAELFRDADSEEGLTDPDALPDDVAYVSMEGDVWTLGPHKVVCGDSTSLETFSLLLGDHKVDACWTDPPYNVNYESSAGKIKNDNMSDDSFGEFLKDAFDSAFAVMKTGAPIYIAHADTEGLNFRSAFRQAGFKISGCLIWSKDSLVLGRSDYQWQHEPILYGWKPGAAHRWYGGRKQTTVLKMGGGGLFAENEDGSITVTVGDRSIVLSGENIKATAVDSTIIHCEKPKRSSDHPTMKPVELISKMLRNSTRDGDLVLDIFGGSGSTLIACETLGRQARLVELDPRFVDVIVQRWQEFTGKQAVLETTGQSFDEAAASRLQLKAG